MKTTFPIKPLLSITLGEEDKLVLGQIFIGLALQYVSLYLQRLNSETLSQFCFKRAVPSRCLVLKNDPAHFSAQAITGIHS